MSSGLLSALFAVILALIVVATSLLARNQRLAREVDRQTRLAAQQAADLARLRRADEAIVERLPDPIIMLDAQQRISRTNAASRAAFGSDAAAVLRHPELRGAVERALATGEVQSVGLSRPVPVRREVLATVVPLDPPLADGGCAIVVLSDLTRERAVERTRSDFVANASHELRTPLASLIGFIDTLRGPAADDPPAQQRFLDIMAEQAARMNRLIDDLLSLSRIELVEHQAPSDRIDLGGLLCIRPPLGIVPRSGVNNSDVGVGERKSFRIFRVSEHDIVGLEGLLVAALFIEPGRHGFVAGGVPGGDSCGFEVIAQRIIRTSLLQ